MRRINAGWMLLAVGLSFIAGFNLGEITKARTIRAHWDALQQSEMTDTDCARFDQFMAEIK